MSTGLGGVTATEGRVRRKPSWSLRVKIRGWNLTGCGTQHHLGRVLRQQLGLGRPSWSLCCGDNSITTLSPYHGHCGRLVQEKKYLGMNVMLVLFLEVLGLYHLQQPINLRLQTPQKATFRLESVQSTDEVTVKKRMRLYYQEDLKEVRLK